MRALNRYHDLVERHGFECDVAIGRKLCVGRYKIIGAAKLEAMFLQFAPSPLTLTGDQVELLRTDNVVSDAAKAEGRTIAAFGIEPEPIEAIVSSYLWRFRKTGQFRSLPTG